MWVSLLIMLSVVLAPETQRKKSVSEKVARRERLKITTLNLDSFQSSKIGFTSQQNPEGNFYRQASRDEGQTLFLIQPHSLSFLWPFFAFQSESTAMGPTKEREIDFKESVGQNNNTRKKRVNDRLFSAHTKTTTTKGEMLCFLISALHIILSQSCLLLLRLPRQRRRRRIPFVRQQSLCWTRLKDFVCSAVKGKVVVRLFGRRLLHHQLLCQPHTHQEELHHEVTMLLLQASITGLA